MAKKNTNLHSAKREKNDEFYTQLADIEKEMKHYKEFFNGKVVFCNCDDPLESNFTKYFILNFHHLGLKKLICTFYDINGRTAFAFEYDGTDLNNDGIINEKDIEIIRQSGACRTILVDDEGFDLSKKDECWSKGIYGSGDFRSKNVIDYLKESDVVVTNPPFSLFREYVAQLMEYGKKFIILGNMNAITYKEIFPYIKNNELWLGCRTLGTDFFFNVPEDYKDELMSTKTQGGGWKIIDGEVMGRVASACWFTNIPHKKRNSPLTLYKAYSAEKYPKYDNYNAIEVSRVTEIPVDYDGVMGVPITFLDKYCPNQFEIIKFRKGDDDKDLSVNGKCPYFRILIRRKK